jgi:acetyl esterase/lipase
VSLVRPALNAWLRLTEKPYLARVQAPARLRRSFDFKARLFFRRPRQVQVARMDVAGVSCLRLRRGVAVGRRILYLHGGAYVFGSARSHSAMLGRLLMDLPEGWEVVLPDYRLAPEHPFPSAFDDAVCVAQQLGPGLVLGGDSAGGGLALAVFAHLTQQCSALRPAGAFAFSPLCDIGFSGASLQENAAQDVVLPASRVRDAADMYLQGASAQDPRVSPLFARFEEAGPVWLCAGTTEILRDDALRMAAHLRGQDVPVTCQIEEDLPHVWPLFHNILPEARQTLRDLAAWIAALPAVDHPSPETSR